jgi:hypothetical protein
MMVTSANSLKCVFNAIPRKVIEMKIRNGFVSNSSSSSYVIAFDKIVKSVEEIPCKKEYAEVIWDHICDQTPVFYCHNTDNKVESLNDNRSLRELAGLIIETRGYTDEDKLTESAKNDLERFLLNEDMKRFENKWCYYLTLSSEGGFGIETEMRFTDANSLFVKFVAWDYLLDGWNQ